MAASWNGGRRRQFPSQLRAAILRRDETCKICRHQPTTVAVAVIEGGPVTLANGMGLCDGCAGRRADAQRVRSARASR